MDVFFGVRASEKRFQVKFLEAVTFKVGEGRKPQIPQRDQDQSRKAGSGAKPVRFG